MYPSPILKVLDLRRTKQWFTRTRGWPFMMGKEHRGMVGLVDSGGGACVGLEDFILDWEIYS